MPTLLKALAIIKGDHKKIKAGEYFIHKETHWSLLNKLSHGQVIQYSLTIIEGSNLSILLSNILDNKKIKSTISNIYINNMVTTININKSHPEGIFYPDTYYFPSGTTDVDFLKRAHKSLIQELRLQWKYRTRNSLKTPYEALILASLIEKESQVDNEITKISGVYNRRLENKIRLQADPTVIYSLNSKYNKVFRITRKDLQFKSLYNTYYVYGLPPTPIAFPSSKSLYAALNPTRGNELFFVADGHGQHNFAATLDEHNKNVNYVRERLRR